MTLNVSSETGRLEAVIVHTPGHEVSLVNPEIKDELLFDDIVFEEDARQEHIDMLAIFKAAMPENGRIIEITDLAQKCFRQKEARSFFVDQINRELPGENLQAVESELKALSSDEFLQFIVEGATEAIPNFTLFPTPNLLFTRDLAAVAGNKIILSRPAKEARLREALMMKTIVNYHPVFEQVRDRIISIPPQASIEGGDVLVASDKLVLIGMSERTSFSGLMIAAEALLNNGTEHVLAVDIPKRRASMHLDTIFTFASDNECIAFPPAVTEMSDNVVLLSKQNGTTTTDTLPSLKQALEELMERDLTFIACGGENRTNQFREQWTDGANVFALAPGIIVGYERNTNTFRALEEHGYTIMDQFDFIEEYRERTLEPGTQKIAVRFRGHELCRGRGGARCMTMPIARES